MDGIKLLPVIGFTLLLGAMSGCGLTASQHSEGYARLTSPGAEDTDITFSLSLGPTVMNMLAIPLADDPGAQAVVRQLDGLQVRQYRINGDASRVSERLQSLRQQLEAQEWQPAIAVREDGEDTYVLVKQRGETITGVTVINSDGNEVVLVNAMGSFHPAELKALYAGDDPAIARIAATR